MINYWWLFILVGVILLPLTFYLQVKRMQFFLKNGLQDMDTALTQGIMPVIFLGFIGGISTVIGVICLIVWLIKG